MKRGLSIILALCLLIAALPAAMAAPSWRETLEAAGQAGLEVTWYPDYESLTRLYGTDRMLLQQNGLFALCDLGGTDFTGFVFDAVAQPSEDGTVLAMKNGKWGKIDQNGNVLVNFIYATQEEAKCPVNVQIVQKNGLFAIADLNGKLLTGYDYWNAKPFVNGYAALQNSEGRWGYIDGNGAVAVPFDYLADIGGMGDVGEDGYAIIQVVSKYYAVSILGDDLLGVGMRKLWRAGQGMWGFVDDSGKVGFADSDGNVVVEAQYVYYTDPKGFLRGGFFDEKGVAQVYTDFGDGARVLIDMNGNILDSYPAETTIREESQGLYMTEQVASVRPWGFVDESGELVVPYLFDAVGRFENGFASVRAGGVYGLLRHPTLCSDWAQEELAEAQANGYVTEHCRFYPKDAITRLQFAELSVNWLEKATGKTIEPAPADTFTDTEDEMVRKAYAAGIVQGMGDGIFRPGGLLTREQLATMLWRAMKAAGVTAENPADLTTYVDGELVSAWAQEGLSALVALNVMEGTGGNALSPQISCTVEQAILLAWRAAE